MALSPSRFPFAASPLDQALHLICAQMQITRTQRQLAEDRYHAVANYLARDAGPLASFGLDIYPQGSLRIGTTVKPLASNEFDLDLVCHLDERSPEWDKNPNALLLLLERDLKANGHYATMVKRMKRCLRLEYSGEFHLDILPGCQDDVRCETCIEVPDRELKEWKASNPKGYAEWFEEQAVELPLIFEARASMFKAAEIEPLPAESPYTIEPLKRTVQLLKRNRDRFFLFYKTPPTPSVIITTLAAQQYGGNPSVAMAILNVLEGIELQAKLDEANQPEGRLVVLNPMNEHEDFSDKWSDTNRYNAFKAWVQYLKSNMIEIMVKADAQGVAAAEEELARLFGENLVTPAMRTLKEQFPDYFRPASTSGLPVPNRMSLAAVLGKYVQGTVLAPTFRLLVMASHRLRPSERWVMDLSPDCRVNISVKAHAKHPPHGYRNTFNYPSDGISLPKDTQLFFKAHTNVQPPFDVQWRVTNTGQEALVNRQLRGEFYEGEGPNCLERTETTSYRGSHFVDVFILMDGKCVARSEPFVVNIK